MLLDFGAEYFVFRFVIQNIKIKTYIIVILPVFYGCETCFLTLREERRLRTFENRVPKRIFGAKRDKVTREWRRPGAL
jgi:hypothetical protein